MSIKTFVVLDLEVNDYPQYQFNRCSITELCLYAISSKLIKVNNIKKSGRVVKKAPKLPRVLHKINLLINPQKRIQDNTRTGLNNNMLENEPPFDTDTADCILKFLSRLEKPVCLVAHNGMRHDFPILRYSYERIQQTFPSHILCVDSLDAFREIDKWLYQLAKAGKVTVIEKEECKKNTDDVLKNSPGTSSENVNENVNISMNDEMQKADESTWAYPSSADLLDLLNSLENKGGENISATSQENNETTPKRSTCNSSSYVQAKSSTLKSTGNKQTNAKRQLQFDGESKNKRKGSYKLGELYEELFEEEKCKDLHQAETDTKILTQLILHYGVEFVKYADVQKLSFDKVPELGTF